MWDLSISLPLKVLAACFLAFLVFECRNTNDNKPVENGKVELIDIVIGEVGVENSNMDTTLL